MAGRRKGSGGKTDGWLFAEDIVFSIGQPDGRSAQDAVGDAAGDAHADVDDSSARAVRRRRISRSTVRRPRTPAAPVSAASPPPPASTVITPPPANVAAARSLAGPAVTAPGPISNDDPVDGWSADAVAGRPSRTAFGKRGALQSEPHGPSVAAEPGSMARTPSIAPERRVRLLEIAPPERHVEPPPPRRSVGRALAGIAALCLIVAGAGAAWVYVDQSGLLQGLSVADLGPEPAPDHAGLPLRAADAPTRSAAIDPAAGPATPVAPDAGGPVAKAVDPLLSSDRISAMGLPGSDDGTAAPAPSVPGAAAVAAAPPADVPVADAPRPLDDGPDPTADGAPAATATPSDPDADIALAEPPAPVDAGAATGPDPAEPQAPALDTELAAPAEPPLPPARPEDEIDRILAAANASQPTDILAGAATLEPDPTPTGSLPDEAGTGVERPAGRVIIGRIIPPAEFEARLRGERPVVGQIIPPEAFDTASTIDPSTRRTIEDLIPPRDVGASPYAAEEPQPKVEAFDVATAEPPAAASPDASVADVAGDNLRVVVHVPRTSDSGLDGRIGETFATMPGRVEIKVVNVRPTETMVRYYHAEDRETAQALRRQLAAAEGDWEVNLSDFTDYRPTPRKGLIEVWLSDSPSAQ